MKHPPYHLRPNKAIDRLLFLDLVDHLIPTCDLKDYTYYSLGGPFLEDIRVFSHRFPQLSFVSVEKSEETFKRQRFHQCTKKLTLKKTDLNSFLKHQFPSESKCIVWLDYSDLRPDRIEEFVELLGLVGIPSIIKVTLRADVDRSPIEAAEQFLSTDLAEKLERDWLIDFQQKFDDYLAKQVNINDLERSHVPCLVQSMLRIATQRFLREATGVVFQHAHSCKYADGPSQMLSVTGVVCSTQQRRSMCDSLKSWKFGSTDWPAPQVIDVPILSPRERFRLEKSLPAPRATAATLQRALRYKIDDSQSASERKLEQYRDYHQFYPLFARIEV